MKRREFTTLLAAAVGGSVAGCAGPQIPSQLPAPLEKPSYAEAVAGIRATIAQDAANPLLAGTALPRLYDHGKRTRNAVVMYHGFTNCPQQFDLLAQQFHARGCNVYVPRIPRHGEKDRLTFTLSDLTGGELADSGLESYRLASGLGDRITALGLSLGGAITLWLAQTQTVDLAVPISPFLMPIGVGRNFGNAAMHALYTIPSWYMWWDPRVKAKCLPEYAYPGFPTHALAMVTFFADAIFAFAGNVKPLGKNCTLVLNQNESAVNNNVTRDLMAQWKNLGANYEIDVLTNLGEPRHDIIDPTTFPQGEKLVYPRIEQIVLG
jgi:pimeloyl-ACP methyl ester carboxylesterase